jgi:hypothetical protein
MLAAAIALVAAMPVELAGERSLFHLPDAAEVRVQSVARNGNEPEWPFSVEAGQLACVWSVGQRQVFFVEGRPANLASDTDFAPRMVILSIDPFQLTIGNIANRTLFASMRDVADLVRRVAPFITLGQRLCDQPPGAVVRSGEL